MKYQTIVIFILLLIACENKTNSTSQVVDGKALTDNELFTEFLNGIPFHEVPIRLACGLPDYTWTNELKKYKQFLPDKYEAVYGLIGHTKDFKCVMFANVGDDVYPTLFTFDNNGKVIDSLYLILSPCGAVDEHLIPSSVAIIDKNFNIILQDTLRYIHYPESTGNYILDSIKTSKKEYTVNEDGRIIEN